MSTVVGSDIFTNTWNTVYQLISGNVVDTASATRGGSAWIYADFPMIQEGKTDEHPGYPIITIDPFELMGMSHTFGKRENTLNSTITVHTRNKRDVDVISSDIQDTLASNIKVLGASGLHNMEFTVGGVETVAFDRYNKFHTKMMGFKVDTVL